MVASGMLHRAAVAAAPILKLWPACDFWSIPVRVRVLWTDVTKWSLLRSFPSWYRKRGPNSSPLTARYASMAEMGHNSFLVRPRYTL